MLLSAGLLVPPLRQADARRLRHAGVVRRVVEEHQAGLEHVAEIEDVEAGGRLIEAIAVAARIDAEEAAKTLEVLTMLGEAQAEMEALRTPVNP